MSSRHRAGRLGMGGAGVRSMARLNSAHEVQAVAGVLLLSEVRARCRFGEVIVVVVVVFVLLVVFVVVAVVVLVLVLVSFLALVFVFVELLPSLSL